MLWTGKCIPLCVHEITTCHLAVCYETANLKVCVVLRAFMGCQKQSVK